MSKQWQDRENTTLENLLTGGGEGGNKGTSLPSPVSPAWYSAAEKQWYGQNDLKDLSRSERNKLVACEMLCQFSPTNRAGCRRCGEKIEKDTLRLGYPFRWRANEDCYSVWLHSTCYAPEVFGIKEKDLSKKIFGYSALNNTEKTKLWKAMRSGKGTGKEAQKAGEAASEALASSSIGTQVKLKPAKIPKAITVHLLPFQSEALSWMTAQEDNEKTRGGILADEMGMGKTLEMISLLVARPLPGPCLIVVPLAALLQWDQEIKRFLKPGTLKVLIYHGLNRTTNVNALKKVDIVLTSYQTLENDYRRQVNKHKVACKYCGRMFLPDKLKVHQKYFCGPDAVRTAKLQQTHRKDQAAARKGMVTMGITSSQLPSKPPTITNIYKEYMDEAGIKVKASGYYAINREMSQRKNDQDALNRERLALLDKAELQALCRKKGVDSTGVKPAMIERLMKIAVKNMKLSGSKITVKQEPVSARPSHLSASDLRKMKMSDLHSTARKFGITDPSKSSKAELADKVERLSAKLGRGNKLAKMAKSQAGGKRKASTAGTGDAKRQKISGGKKGMQPSSSASSSSSARTVASVGHGYQAQGNSKAGAKKGQKGVSKKTSSKLAKVSKSNAASGRRFMVENDDLDISGSLLHSVTWSRVVLDEAHRIKGRTNSTAMAAYALKVNGFRWCMTGTPLQNRVGELYSLIRFLAIKPFAFYYCKKAGCTCECLHFMRERYCPNCGHIRFMHYSYFRSKVTNPIIKYGYIGQGKAAFLTLRNEVLGKCMLRRTKEERKKDLKLPSLKIRIRKDNLSKDEMDFYKSIYSQAAVQFGTYVAKGTILHNYAHIFDLLTTLRRAVDHPYLIVYGNAAPKHIIGGKAGKAIAPPKLQDVCGLCQDAINDERDDEPKCVAKCGHAFHRDCLKDFMEEANNLPSGKGVGCPVCFTRLVVDLGDEDDDDLPSKSPMKQLKTPKTPIKTPMKVVKRPFSLSPSFSSAKKIKAEKLSSPRSPKIKSEKSEDESKLSVSAMGKNSILQKFRVSDWQSSTKIEAVIDEIQTMKQADRTNKAIIFSQFGAMLELVEYRLKKAGISCVVFRGGMSLQARNDSLVAFNSDPQLKVILISLKAGGEGLNLQAASHVLLLDPWWNPACEFQAIQRAHRIGQKRAVTAIRFISRNTIEEKILQLQEKKQLVFEGAIGGDSASISKLTEQDLRFLFQS